MDETEKRLIKFTSSITYDDLTPAVIKATKIRLIDSFGCALGAINAPTVKAAENISAPVEEGRSARIFGTLKRVSVEHATLVNSAMVRYLDLSDAYLMRSTAHPSDNIPGILALGEAIDALPQDLLVAIVVSYEIQIRLCDTAPFNAEGYDQPVCSASAMALASARLLKLDAEQMRHAAAIAATANIALNQTRRGNLSMWKGMAGPNAAREGVFAALLAENGMSGPEDPFEGIHGLYAKTVGKFDRIQIPNKLKQSTIFALQKTNVKTFPVRDAIQVPIFAALKLSKAINASEIKNLTIYTYRHGFEKWIDQNATWEPRTRETADHSLPFCVAATLLDGKLNGMSFENNRYLQQDVRELISKIEIVFDDAFDDVAPETRSCRLDAALKTGESFSAEYVQTPEDVLRGPDIECVETKFRTLTEGVIKKPQQDKILDTLWNFERLESIQSLVSLTRAIC
tara:strand:- start:725 stop:2095 length:1371 start_codon:yes stop_codon:yes gene_type:complete